MRVLQLGKFYPIRGGVEKVMWDLTAGLPAAGVACDMLCAILPGEGPDPKDAPYASETEEGLLFCLPGGGRVFCVKALTKKAATMLSPAMVRWLRRHHHEYDIIHVHHPDPMACLALRLSGYKGRVILHWHSDILKKKAILAAYKPLQSWLIRRAEMIVGTTPVYVRESPHLAHVQDKCTAVSIGIEPLEPAPERTAEIRSRFAGKKLILSIGRLVPYKGYPYLIEAMKMLPEDYHLVIGGTGPLREQLEKQIQALNLQNRVTLTGYIDDTDISAWFGACDCFVLTSTMKTEAFGIVQLEAMSCHKPIVATRIPGSGVAWVNEDGVSGRNVTPGKPEEYAAAIQEVTANSEKFGESAYLRYLKCFTRQQMLTQIQKLYENV